MEELINSGKWPLFYAIDEDTGASFEPFRDQSIAKKTLGDFNSIRPLCEGAVFALGDKMFEVVECKTVDLREYLVTLLVIRNR